MDTIVIVVFIVVFFNYYSVNLLEKNNAKKTDNKDNETKE